MNYIGLIELRLRGGEAKAPEREHSDNKLAPVYSIAQLADGGNCGW